MKKLGLLSAVLAGFVLTACSEGVMEPVGMFAPEGVAFHHFATGPDIEAADWDIDVDGTTVSITWEWINMNSNDVDTPDGSASWVEFQACSSAASADCSGTEYTSADLGGINTFYQRLDTPLGFYRIRIGHKHGSHATRWSVSYSDVFEVAAAGIEWHLTGFYRPVNPDPTVLNRIRRNAAVPLKFNVFEDEEMELEITDVDELAANFSVQPIICNGDANDELEDFEVKGQTVLRYDTEGSQFVQNWQAPRNPGCYEVTLTTEGGHLSAKFQVF